MPSPNRILIIGAGIGGLTLAHALDHYDIPYDILDRVPTNAPVGAGLMLQPNALRLLDAQGHHHALRKRGQTFTTTGLARPDGSPLQNVRLDTLGPNTHALAIHRADLHDILNENLNVQWGTTALKLELHPTHMDAHLSDGSQRQYALVIGADGLRSPTRTQHFTPAPPRYSGYTCWRFITRHLAKLTHPTEYWGAGRRLGLVNIGQGRSYGYATLNAPAGTPDVLTGRAQRLQHHFKEFAAAQDALATLTDQDIIHDDLNEHPQHQWAQGRLALLGDAAHAMTPNLGQGAGMAIEDAIVLAGSLHRHGLTPAALGTYAQLRRQRVQQIANQARLIGQLGQLQHPLLTTARNLLLSRAPARPMQANLQRQLITDAPQAPQR